MSQLRHPIVPPDGPRDCPFAVVGEAPGDEEILRGKPFVGPSGRLLNRYLSAAGFRRGENVLVTNVFDYKLPGNSVKSIGVGARQRPRPVGDWYDPWASAQVEIGCWIPPEHGRPALERLRDELGGVKAALACGGTAAWALLGLRTAGRVGNLRGTVSESPLVPGLLVVVTWHPAAVLRNYGLSPLLWADILKARRVLKAPAWEPPKVKVELAQQTRDVEEFLWKARHHLCAVDIETHRGQIDMIGFAVGNRALVVPFIAKDGSHWWLSEGQEWRVMRAIRDYLADPGAPKLFHNAAFDVWVLWEWWRMPVRGQVEDTMVAHHAFNPEMPKDLGTLASLYTDLPSWKSMRKEG